MIQLYTSVNFSVYRSRFIEDHNRTILRKTNSILHVQGREYEAFFLGLIHLQFRAFESGLEAAFRFVKVDDMPDGSEVLNLIFSYGGR